MEAVEWVVKSISPISFSFDDHVIMIIINGAGLRTGDCIIEMDDDGCKTVDQKRYCFF